MNPDQDNRSSARGLGEYLSSDVPAQLVMAGDLPMALLSRPVEGVSVLRFDTLADAENHKSQYVTDNDGAGPLTLVLQLEVDTPQLVQCLGRAIRAFPYRVLVHCAQAQARSPESTNLADELFFSLGFRKLQLIADETVSHTPVLLRMFEYRLSQYKTSPDWLNARFWANPARFENDEDPDVYCDDEEE